jgi:pectate disaccharide-lyase
MPTPPPLSRSTLSLVTLLAACGVGAPPWLDAGPPVLDAGNAGPRDAAGPPELPPLRDAGAGADGGAPLAEDARTPEDGSTDASTTDAAADPPVAAGPNDLWISPDGDDAAPGTERAPLRSLSLAAERLSLGATLWVRPGTYSLAATVRLGRVATASAPLRIFAAPGPRPMLDFAQQKQGDSSARGLAVSGAYYHLRGLELARAGDNCVHVSGSHNTFEDLRIHDCSDTGLQITANGSEAGDPTRAAHNLVLNCDSYGNYDAANAGENADGFAAKLYIGPGNVFRGCRAFHNADDGWDLFAADDVVTIEDSWAVANGRVGAGLDGTAGDGNGFKLGGAPAAGDPNQGGAVHVIRRCRSVENATCGFTRNNNPRLPALSQCGGRADGKGTFCNLTVSGELPVTLDAAEVIALERLPGGALP